MKFLHCKGAKNFTCKGPGKTFPIRQAVIPICPLAMWKFFLSLRLTAPGNRLWWNGRKTLVYVLFLYSDLPLAIFFPRYTRFFPLSLVPRTHCLFLPRLCNSVWPVVYCLHPPPWSHFGDIFPSTTLPRPRFVFKWKIRNRLDSWKYEIFERRTVDQCADIRGSCAA